MSAERNVDEKTVLDGQPSNVQDSTIDQSDLKKTIKKSIVYTRTGDDGQTSLFNGDRVSKADDRINIIGSVDSLNAIIGASIFKLRKMRAKCFNSQKKKEFEKVISELSDISYHCHDIGAVVATPLTSSTKAKIEKVKLDTNIVSDLEEKIDYLSHHSPKIRHFVLPDGPGCYLHMARTKCRETERLLVQFREKELHETFVNEQPKRRKQRLLDGDIDILVYKYINRLSDYLFEAARYVNHLAEFEDRYYIKVKRADVDPAKSRKRAVKNTDVSDETPMTAPLESNNV